MKNDLEIQVILFPEDAVLRGVIMRNGSRPRRIELRGDAPRAHQLSCLRTILRQNVKFSFIACCAVLHNADREESVRRQDGTKLRYFAFVYYYQLYF